MTTHYTRGQEQDVRMALKLLEELVGHADRIATALEALAEAGFIGYDPDETEYRPPRPEVDVELPNDDWVLCERCHTARPVDPLHPGQPVVHECIADWERPDQRKVVVDDPRVPQRDLGAVNPDV